MRYRRRWDGVKFKDADLVGIPLRIVIGPRGLKEGKLELKWRWDSEVQMIDRARNMFSTAAAQFSSG